MHDKQRRWPKRFFSFPLKSERRAQWGIRFYYSLSHCGSKRRSPQMKKVAKGFLCYLISHFSFAWPRSGMPRDALSPDVALKTQFYLLKCLCTLFSLKLNIYAWKLYIMETLVQNLSENLKSLNYEGQNTLIDWKIYFLYKIIANQFH